MKKNIKKLIETIKKNKRYKVLSDEFIEKIIDEYFRKNPSKRKFLTRVRSEKFKNIVKDIRSILFKSIILFDSKKIEDIDKLLRKLEEILKKKQFKSKESVKLHEKILKKSISTKERLPFYKELYKKILPKKTKIILDIGSGLNPFSLVFMNLNKINYYAYDINKNIVNILKKYFKIIKDKTKIEGKSKLFDIKHADLKKLPKSDVVFLFKLLDVLEQKKHKLAEKIIKELNSKIIVISFAIRTISGKKMNFPERGWIERMLHRIKLKFEKIYFKNEIFYIIKKNV